HIVFEAVIEPALAQEREVRLQATADETIDVLVLLDQARIRQSIDEHGALEMRRQEIVNGMRHMQMTSRRDDDGLDQEMGRAEVRDKLMVDVMSDPGRALG